MYNLKRKTVKPTSTPFPTPSNVPIENLSKSEVWDYFRSEMKNLKVVNKLNPEQGKLFVDELQSSIEKHIQKNGQKFDSELSKLKTQFENIKSPVERKKLIEQTHKSIDELGVKRNLSQSTIKSYKKLMSDIERLPIGTLQKGIMYSTIVSTVLDGIRLYDEEEEFKGHLGLPFLVSGGGNIASAYLGYVLLRYNPLGFLVSVGLTIESIVRFGKYGYKKVTNVKPGTEPFIDDGSTGNTNDLDGIKN
jgi:polyhydroxyalkanoate synthesis regulator phasin